MTSYYEVGYDPDFFLGCEVSYYCKVWNLFVPYSFFLLNHKKLKKKNLTKKVARFLYVQVGSQNEKGCYFFSLCLLLIAKFG
jgi:hypothetical protein